ncbi:Homocysteine S-methyltransferase [Purpureocillium takamizusanense]|uniref:Homocysteine S-methyltransferase n=1 Tax=Purpureocillium takamizusanense TaxID=2060973 RepID=A0A9Q8Q624_9HYPO|nr:Homocysteine S-methyltransferase [Purpureocillium takamizusanense]UNI13675.1 Homocysteine S-methyltransferase [Purpureocillium takamizusanense]
MSAEPPILILDGGLGTSLERSYGCVFTPATPLWSSHLLVSDPSLLQRCQADFARGVPVDVLLTATYQFSVAGFAGTRTPDHPRGIPRPDIPRFVEAAVRVAEQARGMPRHEGGHARLALSLGPYGACMIPSQEYSGRYDAEHDAEDALREWHADRMRLFGGVADLASRIQYVALETIPRVDEIRALRRAIGAVPELARRPFWMSCLFPHAADDDTLPDGSSAEEAVRAMLDPGVASARPWGVGINCTKVWKLDALLRRYEAAVAGLLSDGLIEAWPALVLYPDGTNGEVYNTATQKWELPEDAKGESRETWEDQLRDAVLGTQQRGAWRQIIVGGCCMAGADDIKRLRHALLGK